MATEYPFRVWDGVYRTFAEAAADEVVFEGDVWLNKSVARASDAIANARSDASISPAMMTKDYVLPTVAATMAGEGRPLRILDFGGGLGTSFLPVISALPNNQQLKFVIVENPVLCAKGQALFGNDTRISFQTTLPETNTPFDIVHCGSSLHYVEDWKAMLVTFARLGASYIVLADLPAADNRTFVTAQAYYGKRIASWFWNFGDIVSTIEKLGYGLVFKARHRNAFLGPDADLPVGHFDVEHRLEYFSQVIFKRSPPSETSA
jgi:putative methyltransferase (TIGR04325 family)